INGDAAQAVADEIGGLAYPADVSDSAQIDAAFAACIAEFGGVDLAYLNAGIGVGSDFGEFPDEEYVRIRGVNQDHVVYGSRAMVRAVRSRTHGRTGAALVAPPAIPVNHPPTPRPPFPL